ncbi:MAG: hypothetical protein IT379_23550 [Deltaproteobacteria bacterium]|nr:hypothetical protein [Deltaproteobacteria bacterium]
MAERIERGAKPVPYRRFRTRLEAEAHVEALGPSPQYLAAEPYTIVLPDRLPREKRERIVARIDARHARKLAPIEVVEKDGEHLVPVPVEQLADGRIATKADPLADELLLATKAGVEAKPVKR